MTRNFLNGFFCVSIIIACHFDAAAQDRVAETTNQAVLMLRSRQLLAGPDGNRSLKLDSFFYETDKGRVMLPAEVTSRLRRQVGTSTLTMPDGRRIAFSVKESKPG